MKKEIKSTDSTKGMELKNGKYLGWDLAVEEYFNSKKSLESISIKYGINNGNLRNYIIRKGLKPKGKLDRHINPEKRVKAVKMYNKGMLVKDIAKEFGVCRETISIWVREAGVETKTRAERLGITQNLRDKAIKMYTDKGMNCCDISKVIGVSNRSVLKWVDKVKRSRSEIMCKVISEKGSVNIKAKKGFVDTRFGRIYFNSSYERDRINQLEVDNNVSYFGRCTDIIKYRLEDKIRHYNPDFLVIYNGGKKVVEEVKPFVMINKLNNRIKMASAKEFYKDKGIVYKVVTERIIYEK